MNVIARELTDDLTSLVKAIDKKIDENKDQQMAAYFVLLSEDPDADGKKLVELAAKHKIKNVPLTVFDGVAGPPKYKISKDADVTVMLWRARDVKANHSFAKGKLDKKGIEAIVKSTAKILD